MSRLTVTQAQAVNVLGRHVLDRRGIDLPVLEALLPLATAAHATLAAGLSGQDVQRVIDRRRQELAELAPALAKAVQQ